MKNFLAYKRGKFAKGIKPTKIFVTGFIILIALGAFLLSLPISSRTGQWTPPLTALFTATSAACVTGLILVDTHTHWNGFGQAIILFLIQIGGLGFMTIAALLSFFLRRTITLRERLVMTTSLNIQDVSGVVRLTRQIIFGTLFFEGLGAIVLSIRFAADFGWVDGIKKGIFHSVSAFCNAGFDLMGREYGPFSGMTHYSGDWIVSLTIMSLIVLGGLGFFVWGDIYRKAGLRKLELHTKVVLCSTAFLILFGWFFFFVIEFNNPLTLGTMPLGEQLLTSLFQSVTVRTAGFNTIDQGSLMGSSYALSMALMFIGGSPGSTAGGIKTVTAAILIITAVSVAMGRTEVTLDRKTISFRTISNAVTLLVLGIAVVCFGAFVIAATEPVSFTAALFEAISAFGTVGLTMNITTTLGPISQITLIILMFLGRIGVITLGMAIFMRRQSEPKLRYPETRLMIG